MRLLKFSRGRYWKLSFFGQPVVMKMVMIRLICRQINPIAVCPKDVELVPMDEELTKRANKMEYRILKFFRQNPDSFYGVAAMRGKSICGYVCGRNEETYDNNKEQCFYIKYVFVNKSSRGERLSAVLIQELAEKVNRQFYYLSCRENNPAALKIYRGLGFSDTYVDESVYFPPIHKGIMKKRYYKEN